MMTRPVRRQHDPRVRQTLGAIVGSFNSMVLRRRYESIKVGDIAARAGVGRSTFYEHFRGKDDVFRRSISPVLTPLADAVLGSECTPVVERILEHLQENLGAARSLIDGEPSGHVRTAHAQLISQRLDRLARLRETGLTVSIDLAAAYLAGGQLGTLSAWLNSPRRCPATLLAQRLVHATRAGADAFCGVSALCPGAGGSAAGPSVD